MLKLLKFVMKNGQVNRKLFLMILEELYSFILLIMLKEVVQLC